MSQKLYTDADADLKLLAPYTIAIVGYGTQGTARGMNVRDSGLKVIVGSTPQSDEWLRAQADGFEVMTVEEAGQRADVFDLEIPDMAFRCAAAYNDVIKPAAKPYHMVCLSSAFNFYYGHLDLAAGADAIVAAPKSPGSAVRTEFVAGGGVPGLLAVHQDASGRAWERGLAYCKAIGFTRAGLQETTVEEETCTDLLGEHCAWGAIVALLRTVYEVMIEAGFDPHVAFFEAINESKLTTDLIYKFGLAGMLERISNTAAYGAMTIGPQIIDQSVKDKIRWALENIRNGGFDQDWKADYEAGYPKYRRLLDEMANHQADVVGNQIRRQLGVLKKDDFTVKNPLK